MEKEYIRPCIEAFVFEMEDVITGSTGDDDPITEEMIIDEITKVRE